MARKKLLEKTNDPNEYFSFLNFLGIIISYDLWSMDLSFTVFLIVQGMGTRTRDVGTRRLMYNVCFGNPLINNNLYRYD